MKKKIAAVLLVLILVAGGAFLYLPRGAVAEAVNNAVLAVLNAGVFAQRTGAPDLSPAFDGEIFSSGDLVRADAQGRAVLTFFEGSTISVEPGSDVRVVSLVKTSGGGIQVLIEQTLGRTWASVSELATPDSKFEIRTPSMVAVVRGTAFETIVEKPPDGTTTTTVKTGDGEVLVQAEAGGEVSVLAGQQVEVEESQPAPPASEPQPPTPKLRVAAPAGVGFIVIDPRGLRCGVAGTAAERQIPRCDVTRDGGQTIVIGDVVPGTYSLVATAAQAVPSATIKAEGIGVAGQDFAHQFASPLAVGDLLRTTLPLTVGGDGKLASAGFSTPELVTSVCGAEAAGRVFSSGKVEERATLLLGYARSSPGQPAAYVVTAAELTAMAQEGLSGAELPITISGVNVTIDNGGLHLGFTAAVGPLNVPARADVIAGALDGKLGMKLRGLDAGIVPQPAKEQIAKAIDQGLAEFGATFPLTVERVAFRSGCMAIIGKTPG